MATMSGSRTTSSGTRSSNSAVSGTPVIALCGKVWVPSRDPKRFPVCPDCKRIYEGLPKGDD